MAVLSGSAAAMPAITPIIGGYLMHWISWQAIFGFLLLLSIILLILVLRLVPETSTLENKELTIKQAFFQYSKLIKSRIFWGYVIPYTMTTGGLIGYYSASPFWFVSQLKYSDNIYSYFLLPTVGMYIMGLIVTLRLIKKYELEQILFSGLVLGISLIALMALSLPFSIAGAVPIIVFMSLFGFSIGFVFPTSNAAALSYFKHISASASALISCCVFAFSSLASFITMKMEINNLWPIVTYLAVLIIIALLSFVLLIRKSPEFDKNANDRYLQNHV